MRAAYSAKAAPCDERRVATCMIGAEDDTHRLALGAVSALEIQLLRRGWPVGASLGGLPHMQDKMGLGRPAFHEALTILEARGLVDIRRGPGGGLFVAAPALDDVVAAMLMYLVISGAHQDCICGFRLLVWRMIIEAAIARRISCLPAAPGEWGFAHGLALEIANPAMVMAALLAEMLVSICEGAAAPSHDMQLDTALNARDLERAFSRLDDLSSHTELAEPLLALEVTESGMYGSGRKSAMALAARMTREMHGGCGAIEAEWETAERLGYTHSVVRQARRILQDFGVVRCRQGRKGAIWTSPASPSGVIRLLAPCLAASGMSVDDIGEAAFFLACSAPGLAAARPRTRGAGALKVLVPSGQSYLDLLRVENMLLDLAGNPLLAIMVRSLGLANISRLPPPWAINSPAKLVVFNRQIVCAVEGGDIQAAGELARAKARAMERSARHYDAVETRNN